MKENFKQTGQVIKGVGGNYEVLCGDNVFNCTGRGKLRLDGNLFIGDYVEITTYGNYKGAIEKVLPRKNKLARPYIVNIDAIIICIAPIPKPDFLLVDKMLINCLKQNITPILCVNKIDLVDDVFLKNINDSYKDLAEIVYVSAYDGRGISELTNLIANKYLAMAGQSAVGKSSIINAIVGKQLLEIGELSRKTERGKHCTRHVEIYDIGYGIRLADTCGFSVLELGEFDPSELSTYYTDFDEYARECRFNMCNHINEPGCAVKKAVEDNKLSKDRYNRYLSMYNDLLEKWRKRYE